MDDTYPRLLRRNYLKWGSSRVAMRKKEFGIWWEYTWHDYYHKVKSLSMGLVGLGIEPGDKVAILGDNNPEWFWAELAAQSIGAVVVGLYTDSLAEEVKYMLEDSESRLVVAQDQEQVDKLLGILDGLPLIRKVVFWDKKGLSRYDDPRLTNFAEVLASGRQYDAAHPGAFEAYIERGKGSDVCMILYTSGTTGSPKGAMVTYDFLRVTGMERMLAFNPIRESDEWFSFILPGWGTEQGLGLIASLIKGQKMNFPEEVETVSEDMREVAPHSLLYASRLWDQLASTIQVNIASTTWRERLLFRMCLPIGYRAADLRLSGRRPNPALRCGHLIAEAMVFRPLRDRHGLVRTRVPYTAGAALSPDSLRFFCAIGVNMRQLYGTTEVGVISLHSREDFKYDSVGRIALGTCVRISPESEILVRSDVCFSGYYRNPEASRRVLDGGWYHTGDAGYVDEAGHLMYLDRLDDMKVLADGTRFSPQYIESRLRFSAFIQDAVALGGHHRPFVGAIINISFDNVGDWAEKNKIAYTTFVDLSQRPEAGELIRKEVERVNAALPEGSKIRRFVNLHKELDADEAELTRTRKLRRSFIEDRYKEVVDAIYGTNDELSVTATVVYKDGRRGQVDSRVRVFTVN